MLKQSRFENMESCITFCRFAIGGFFTSFVAAENYTLINYKIVCRARNPANWKCAVMPSAF